MIEITVNEEYEYWSTGYFKDQFLLDLAKNEKYYEQAKQLMYRIPLTEQHLKSEKEAVPFIIEFQDLSSKVQSEFKEYHRLNDKREVTLLLKEVVIRLFENLDYDYTHMSVMKKLRVSVIE